MIDQPAQPKSTLDYAFLVPGADLINDRLTCPPGSLTRCVGVDGRFRGKLKRFSGMTQTRQFGAVDGIAGPNFPLIDGLPVVEQVTLQLGREVAGLLRGWVFIHTTGGGSPTHKVVFEYYNTSTAVWATTTLATLTTDHQFEAVDITYDHRAIYVCGTTFLGAAKGVYAKAFWLDTTWRSVDMSPDTPLNPTSQSWMTTTADDNLITVAVPAGTANLPSGGHLVYNRSYSFFARVIWPELGLIGPMTTIFSEKNLFGGVVDVGTGGGAADSTFVLELADNTGALGGFGTHATAADLRTTVFGDDVKNRRIQMFRTVSSAYADTTAIGRLYLEKEYKVGDGNGTAKTGETFFWGGLADEALVLQPSLPVEEAQMYTNNLPRFKRIQVYERTMFAVAGAATDSAVIGTVEGAPLDSNGPDSEVYHWSQLNSNQYNSFPIGNRRRPEDLSDRVSDMVKTGPFLALVTENSIIRFHKTGGTLSRDVIHNRYGSVGRWGILGIGSSLFVVSQIGLLVCDLTSGTVEVLGATQHLFDKTSNWRSTLSKVVLAYDSRAGCLVAHNTDSTKHETLLVWLNDGVVTLLKNSPFIFVTTGVDPVNGGQYQAFFIRETAIGPNDRARVYTIDVAAAATRHTMNGGSNSFTYNGTATSGGGNSLVDTAATFDNEQLGFYVTLIRSGIPLESKRIDSLIGSTQLIITGTWTSNPVAGDTYSIAAIPFQVTAWPISGDPQRPVLDMFHIKKITAMQALVETGDAVTGSAVNHKLIFQGWGRDETTPLVQASSTMPTTNTASAAICKASVPVGRSLLLPGVEQWEADSDFALLGLLVYGTIEGSRHEGA